MVMEAKKLGKLNINDFVKDNSPGPRLQSLRLPRDLSLGGTKFPKKNYAPNLNVIRNKDKAKVLIKKVDKSRSRNGHHQDKAKDRFIQSSGVFSEGIGDSIRLPQNRVYVRDREKTPPVKQQSQKVYKKVDNPVFEEIIKYDDDSDSDKELAVPFMPIDWCPNKLLKDPLTEVKHELPDVEKLLPKEYQEGTEDTKISLTLWQVPDSFSFKNVADNIDNKKPVTDCKLSDVAEGKIGKICVHRSGRMVVYIGNLQYELESAELESFVEEAVSISVNASEDSKATVLGNIDNRFLLNPLWSSLLH